MPYSIIKTSKNLRQNATEAEQILWKYLRAKQLNNLKFKRQQPIGRYIVDFVCFEKYMVIEIDGGQHSLEKSKDNERDEYLKSQCFNVLRFWNNEVLTNIEGVLEIIKNELLNHPPLSPPIEGGGIPYVKA